MQHAIIPDKKISDIAHRQVMAALREILSDPDRGLALRPDFIRRMKKSIRSKEAGRTKNLQDVLVRHGVN